MKRIIISGVLIVAAIVMVVFAAVSNAEVAGAVTPPSLEDLPIDSEVEEPVIESAQPEPVYTVKSYQGYIAVFSDGQTAPIEITEIAVALLRRADQTLLSYGVTVVGEENLARFLEDFAN